MKYPRTLYKKSKDGALDFTNKEHRHVMYDSLVVENEEELEAAKEMGYVDDFHDALFGEPPAKPNKPAKEEDEPKKAPSMKIEAGF